MGNGLTHGTWGRPRGGPWWRFVPWSTAAGYASALAAFVLLVQALAKLLHGDHPAAVLVLEAVIAVVSVCWLAQSIDGLGVLRGRRRAERG